MRLKTNNQIPLLAFSVITCLGCNEAFGYINPSSGYILWQLLFGTVVGLLFFVKKFWMFFVGLFKKKKP